MISSTSDHGNKHSTVCSKTYVRRLRERSLSFRSLLRPLPVTSAHQQMRLKWLWARYTLNLTEWRRIFFSDVFSYEMSLKMAVTAVRYSHKYKTNTARKLGVMI